MITEKLYIIGNGFDIYHGIPSRYTDFRTYLEQSDRSLCQKLENYFSYEGLWADFEQSLADFDADRLIEDASNFLVSYGSDDWSDSYHHDFQYEINEVVVALSQTLKLKFAEWIAQLPIPSELDIKNKKLGCIDKNSTFLSFNYTNTLQAAYLVSDSHVLHIHMKYLVNGPDLVLGHAWKPVKRNALMHQDDLERQDVRIAEGDKIIDRYFKTTYKPTEEIIKLNGEYFASLRRTKEIYVLGHSMSCVDIPYFQEIVRSIDARNTKWYISYFDEKELASHQGAMNALGIRAELINFSDLKSI